MVTRFGLRTADGRLTVAPDELTAYAWLDYAFGEKYTIGSANERLVADDGTGWKFVRQEDLDEYHNRSSSLTVLPVRERNARQASCNHRLP